MHFHRRNLLYVRKERTGRQAYCKQADGRRDGGSKTNTTRIMFVPIHIIKIKIYSSRLLALWLELTIGISMLKVIWYTIGLRKALLHNLY